MNRILTQLSTALFLTIASIAAIAQDALPYKDGAVTVVTSVRTQPASSTTTSGISPACIAR